MNINLYSNLPRLPNYFRLKNDLFGNYCFHIVGQIHTHYQCRSPRILLYIYWRLNNNSSRWRGHHCIVHLA